MSRNRGSLVRDEQQRVTWADASVLNGGELVLSRTDASLRPLSDGNRSAAFRMGRFAEVASPFFEDVPSSHVAARRKRMPDTPVEEEG